MKNILVAGTNGSEITSVNVFKEAKGQNVE
jgi:hypothetical protein